MKIVIEKININLTQNGQPSTLERLQSVVDLLSSMNDEKDKEEKTESEEKQSDNN